MTLKNKLENHDICDVDVKEEIRKLMNRNTNIKNHMMLKKKLKFVK